MKDLSKLNSDDVEGIAALINPVQKVRQAAAHTQSMNNLKQIALAMQSYNDTYKHFPPPAITSKDKQPLLSCALAILPYIGENDLYKKFKLDEDWNSPNNKKLIPKMPRTYLNHNAPIVGGEGMTNYCVLVGNGAGFERDKTIGVKDISDGTSKTLMVVESMHGVIWTSPEDLDFDGKTPPNFANFDGRGYNVAFFDATARTLPPTTSQEALRAFITRAAGD